MARVVPMLDSSIELDRNQGFAGLLAVAEADLFNPSGLLSRGSAQYCLELFGCEDERWGPQTHKDAEVFVFADEVNVE